MLKFALASLFIVLSFAQDPNMAYNPHPPFEKPDDLWGVDETIPVEQRIIKLTDEVYDT